MRTLTIATGLLLVALGGCDDGPAGVDAGPDPDAGSALDAGHDASAPPIDAGEDAAVPPGDAGSDGGARADATVGPDAGGVGGGAWCAADAECATGAEWCEGGRCVACDNSGIACRIVCPGGWSVYERNGCYACACAPINDCTADGDCPSPAGRTQRCYAGAFFWDWCPAGDPSCCYGNVCSNAGCPTPAPVGCNVRGCPLGQTCRTEMGCASSECLCGDSGTSECTEDRGGGVCVTP